MNRNQKIILAASVAVIGWSINEYRRMKKREQAEMAKIWQEAAMDLAATQIAGDRVRSRLEAGHRYSNIDELMTDFRFERIAARMEN